MSRPKAKSIKVRSKFEQKLKDQLDEMEVEYGYETKLFKYTTEHKYRPDFVFPSLRLLIEAKGYFDSNDRSKSLHVRDCIRDAGWELAFVFQRASNKLHTRSPTTYADWCDRHGFRWAEGKVPTEWLTPST